MDNTSFITKQTKDNKTDDFRARDYFKISSKKKSDSNSEKETYSLMEMWSYYLNFSRLEF